MKLNPGARKMLFNVQSWCFTACTTLAQGSASICTVVCSAGLAQILAGANVRLNWMWNSKYCKLLLSCSLQLFASSPMLEGLHECSVQQ